MDTGAEKSYGAVNSCSTWVSCQVMEPWLMTSKLSNELVLNTLDLAI